MKLVGFVVLGAGDSWRAGISDGMNSSSIVQTLLSGEMSRAVEALKGLDTEHAGFTAGEIPTAFE